MSKTGSHYFTTLSGSYKSNHVFVNVFFVLVLTML